MTRLDFVDLSDNSIENLPSDGLETLNIVELNLNRNSVSVIPESIARCKRLKVLRVENSMELMGLPTAILSDSKISVWKETCLVKENLKIYSSV